MRSASLGQVRGDKVPIHQMIEKSLHEIRPPILIVEIISVLPNIACQQRRLPFSQRINRIWGGRDLQPPAVGNEPRPAAAKLADRGCLELLLEFVEPAAIAGYRLRDITTRGAAATRLHGIPEEGMVPHLGGIVEDAGLRRVFISSIDYLLE